MKKAYRLRDKRNQPIDSKVPGALGGHKRLKICGRLDCQSALRWLLRGHYKAERVFFLDKPTAHSAGYRPCAVCMPAEHALWKAGKKWW